ncbi:DUF4271 domain-containing protein [Paracrocinitomix mangrovi]|uniref:DUF4271 domain-containing protein n=1 Tax=Paracrocinitomix mangrovi TaxID=2862509 RepID=UPI001C8D4E20|nr:DUF4271 domain-containing protein [Paracrocinitomix mangrovi]UKN03635.1 DUF4271 domain-containing protein [Paracrocinitomix mangrovi]
MPISLLNIFSGDPLHINYEVIFWICMAINLLFIAIAKTLNQQYISLLFNTAIYNRYLIQNTQEELKLNSTSSILLTITYFLNLAALSSYQLAFGYNEVILYFVGTLLAASLIKWLVMWILIFVTENRSGISEHIMNHFIFYQLGGIILTPILILSHFFNENIHETIVLACLIFAGFLILFREAQSILRALKARISILYIILYLCTLELVPLILIINVFVTDSAGLN